MTTTSEKSSEMPFKINNKLIKAAGTEAEAASYEWKCHHRAWLSVEIISLTFSYANVSHYFILPPLDVAMRWSREWVAASEEVISLSLFISFAAFFLRGKLKNWNGKLQNDFIFSSFMSSSIAKRETATLEFPLRGKYISHMTWRDRWF